MRIHEVKNLDDDAAVVISGREFKSILNKAVTLGSGLSPKGEMCFVWGKMLLSIVENAEHRPDL